MRLCAHTLLHGAAIRLECRSMPYPFATAPLHEICVCVWAVGCGCTFPVGQMLPVSPKTAERALSGPRMGLCVRGVFAPGALTGKPAIYTWRCVQFTHAPYGWLVGSYGSILRTADGGSRYDVDTVCTSPPAWCSLVNSGAPGARARPAL
jgi:hypothetical protein